MTDSASVGERTASAPRVRHQVLVSLAVTVSVLVLNLVQQPGLITFDTKLDLQFDPGGFLARSLNLWNADSTVGGLQNQASGYLFPMGPAFWLAGVLGVPMWIWERLWSAAVMLLAYSGARRLAARWPGIGPWGAVVAGLAFMLAPRILLTVGGLSGESLPTAVLPWTIIPLVLYLRGRLRAGVAFLWSAATLPLMGGQNATLVLACLVLPALLLVMVEGRGWRRRIGDVAGWGGLVVLASLWWVVPLLLLGGYAPPFLDFIESAHNTASNIGWLTSVRGTGHWVAFFPGGGSAGWAGGYAVVSSAALLFTTVLVAAVGLAGLLAPGLWARRALVSAVLVGLAILTLGSGGWAGSVLSGWWLDVLDGALAPLRNIHKFDPVIRLPLSLGVGAFVSAGLPRLIALASGWTRQQARAVRAGATGAVVVAVLAAAQPAVSGDLRVQDGMEDISAPWREAVAFLDDQEGPIRALVLPGSGFAVQYWGRTLDEPIQVLDPPPWLARAQVTVAPAGTLRVLDSIEREVDRGRPSEGLSDAFRRLGITHVVVRNDLDRDDSDGPAPDVVYSSLAGADDLTSIGAFGGSRDDARPDVEVFAVDGGPRDPRVSIEDWSAHLVVQGGPEVVNELVSAGLVRPRQATVLATDPDEQADILTDSNRRIERSFGRVHDALSAVMTADEPFRLPRPVHDYTGEQIPEETATAAYDGATLVTASNSQGYADIIGPVRPEEAPYAAFDRSALTAWISAPFSKPVGQWIEADFDHAENVGPLSLWFDTTTGAEVTSVRITTDDGSVTADVDEDGRATNVDVSGSATTKLRITVAAVDGGSAQVRLIDVAPGDHEITRSIEVPGRVTSGSSVYLTSELLKRGCLTTEIGVSCDYGRANETPETAGFDRTVNVDSAVQWRLAGRVVATHGPAVDQLLAPILPTQISAIASSTFGGDPAIAAANAVDDRPDTSWYASPLDSSPSLELSWKRKRTIDHVLATVDGSQPGELPTALVVDPLTRADDVQLVATSGPDAGTMEPVRTNRLRIGVLEGTELPDGLGISELDIGGVNDLKHAPDPFARTGFVCGFGPTVEIGGRSVETRVTGRIGDIVDGSELELEACDDDPIDVGPGEQRIRVTNPSGFAVSRLWFEPADEPAGSTGGSSVPLARAITWSSTDRAVEVEAEDAAVLTLPQSFNRGWSATIDGTRLEPLVVDGWKQAWLVPAGTSGEVRMLFEPQRVFEISIVGGLVLAAAIVVAALVLLLLRRFRPRRTSVSTESPRPVPDAHAGTSPSPRGRRVAAAVGVVLLALVSVPLAMGAVGGFFLRRPGPVVLWAVCGAGMAAAAVVAAWGTGTVVVPPPLADAITAAVVGAVCGAVLSAREEPEGEPS